MADAELEGDLLLVLHGVEGRRDLRDLDGTEAALDERHETLEELDRSLEAAASAAGASLECYQSNHEGELVERIHAAGDGPVQGILINPGGLGHTSVVLRDALLAAELPFVEVHCSNTASREEFRHRSLLTDIAVGIVMGFGPESYRLGLAALLGHLGRGDA